VEAVRAQLADLSAELGVEIRIQLVEDDQL
jgi:hypothetical protein